MADDKPTEEAPKPAAEDPIVDGNPAEELSSTELYIKVYSPYQVYFDGKAKSISAENDTGPFDILPKHHNFMTLVNAGDVTIRPADGSESKKIRITKGVMHVRTNKVTLFLDV